MKLFLSGNEAIAKGAFDAGVRFASAYPGTPSTEILETIGKEYPEIESEWSINEKVALEVGIGASLAGARTLVAMKHVGINVAADPLFTFAYTGVNAGLVLISADDPGMHSSQNEQDNRRYAKSAKVPMLEPSNSQEAYDYIRLALDLSEKYDFPVMLRMTTRISHAKTIVDTSAPKKTKVEFTFKKDPKKYVMVPAHARARHIDLEGRLVKLTELADNSDINQIIKGKPGQDVGIIAGGVDYQYAREVFPGYPFLKIGMMNPLPEKLIKKFAKGKKKLIIIEAGDPYIEEHIRALELGIEIEGKNKTGLCGELSVERLREAFKIKAAIAKPTVIKNPPQMPIRFPILCPGCGHRGIFFILKKLKCLVTGDIGCYTLGTLPPLEAMDVCICMGASLGTASGMSAIQKYAEKEGQKEAGKKQNIVGVIGDSTFNHSGITPLVNAIYNKRDVTFLILDNSTTAMTGHQEHPGTGKTLSGEPTLSMDYEKLALALGANYVTSCDPYDLKATEETLKESFEKPGVKVVIVKRQCVQLKFVKATGKVAAVDQAKCKYCKLCLKVGCPAIILKNDKVAIDETLCSGCGICVQVCPFSALDLKTR